MIGNDHELHTANWDILLKMHDGRLQRISEIYSLYDLLHYVLLFSRDNDSWHVNVSLIDSVKQERITAMQFYSYWFQIRDGDWLQNAGYLY